MHLSIFRLVQTKERRNFCIFMGLCKIFNFSMNKSHWIMAEYFLKQFFKKNMGKKFSEKFLRQTQGGEIHYGPFFQAWMAEKNCLGNISRKIRRHFGRGGGGTTTTRKMLVESREDEKTKIFWTILVPLSKMLKIRFLQLSNRQKLNFQDFWKRRILNGNSKLPIIDYLSKIRFKSFFRFSSHFGTSTKNRIYEKINDSILLQ